MPCKKQKTNLVAYGSDVQADLIRRTLAFLFPPQERWPSVQSWIPMPPQPRTGMKCRVKEWTSWVSTSFAASVNRCCIPLVCSGTLALLQNGTSNSFSEGGKLIQGARRKLMELQPPSFKNGWIKMCFKMVDRRGRAGTEGPGTVMDHQDAKASPSWWTLPQDQYFLSVFSLTSYPFIILSNFPFLELNFLFQLLLVSLLLWWRPHFSLLYFM